MSTELQATLISLNSAIETLRHAERHLIDAATYGIGSPESEILACAEQLTRLIPDRLARDIMRDIETGGL